MKSVVRERYLRHVAGVLVACLSFFAMSTWVDEVLSTLYYRFWHDSTVVSLGGTSLYVREQMDREAGMVDVYATYGEASRAIVAFPITGNDWYTNGFLEILDYTISFVTYGTLYTGSMYEAAGCLRIYFGDGKSLRDYCDLNWDGNFELMSEGPFDAPERLWIIADDVWHEVRFSDEGIFHKEMETRVLWQDNRWDWDVE